MSTAEVLLVTEGKWLVGLLAPCEKCANYNRFDAGDTIRAWYIWDYSIVRAVNYWKTTDI